MIDVEEYIRDNHGNPFEKWFASLDVQKDIRRAKLLVDEYKRRKSAELHTR
ncbi:MULTISPECIES: hypothetical protein [Pseudomonas]|uniref:Uncharacterized protein n=1 Tax=Pseudomonas gingeri TaxID=117681 RepID=A0A7Y7Y4Y0_9PSED|nr:hypothetical protein [Pseudomonas gingeri]NWB30797.1 hypothetical protein [Pseudomonas gingeri]NWC17943.1 hypothetical protein [Pseudomonas gingeri]NWC31355.1 hypothetical protein [Pseudomonas gingeri]NWE45495.1 hypothetical protein [Pseudomonas gingeri]NWE72732.1 hypothetical protein [Pseudomonas gingeri]